MRINSLNNVYTNNSGKIPLTVDRPGYNVSKNSPISEQKKVSADNALAYHLSFGSAGNNTSAINENQYKTIFKSADKETRAMLKGLKENHILENKTSNDGSTVLDNLYKIATTERIQGLSQENILKETVKAISNPYTITQKFGDLPKEVIPQIEQSINAPVPQNAYQVASASCVATSIEFNLASKRPAEFVRMVEGLTSPNYSIVNTLNLENISPNFTEALHELNEFNVKYQITPDWKSVKVALQPDKNAIIRARVQNDYKDELERSSIDVLMQSTIMNLGSQQTYDTLTDKRKIGKYNPNDSGLTNLENNFAEKIIDGKPKVSIVYQNLDENGVLKDYNCDMSEIKDNILKTLELGDNIIVGYTMFDENKKVLGGHEITIVGTAEKNGKQYFVCNDTDDNLSEPIVYDADEFLPLIHHADLPAAIFPEYEEQSKNNWKTVLEDIKSQMNAAQQAIN